MEKARNGSPATRLSISAIAGFFCGIAIFFIFNIVTHGSNIWKYAIMSLFAGLLIFTSTTTVILFILYKRTSKAMSKIIEQSSMDGLTELYNRSYLDPFLDGKIEAAKRENQQVSVMMVDMDHFKEINDTYGHVVGDSVLAIFAQVVQKCLRKTDIIARYGGDEFIVVLPNTDTETASSVADRIRKEVAETYIPPIDDVIISSIHCSIGISNYPVLCDSKSTLIKTSDLALYMAKRSGRDCTRVYTGKPALG